MIRRGSVIIVEASLGLAGLALMGLLSVAVVQSQQGLRRCERHAVLLEVGQNLLDALRVGQKPELPQGWSIELAPAADGVELVSVIGPNLRLATLRRATP